MAANDDMKSPPGVYWKDGEFFLRITIPFGVVPDTVVYDVTDTHITFRGVGDDGVTCGFDFDWRAPVKSETLQVKVHQYTTIEVEKQTEEYWTLPYSEADEAVYGDFSSAGSSGNWYPIP